MTVHPCHPMQLLLTIDKEAVLVLDFSRTCHGLSQQSNVCCVLQRNADACIAPVTFFTPWQLLSLPDAHTTLKSNARVGFILAKADGQCFCAICIVHIASYRTLMFAGARRVQDNLELHVKWSDGFDTWLSLEALKKRQHCKTDIIDFLVSKVRKKSKN